MTFLPLIWLSAQSLFAPDAIEPEKLRVLTPMLSPAPDRMLILNTRELVDHRSRTQSGLMRGVIRVTPPKGRCLTITRASDLPDDVICRPTPLSWTLAELDHAGKLHWTIKTGDGDFGTPISWSTPYRVAVAMPLNFEPSDPPEYHYIESCHADRSADGASRILLKLISGPTWVIRFPAEHKMVPQPDALPNLFVAYQTGKVSVADAAERDQKASGAGNGSGKGTGTGTGAGSEKPAEDHAPAPDAAKKVSVKDAAAAKAAPEQVDRLKWSIPQRGAYSMNAANFMPAGSVAGKLKGECRYAFQGSPDDPETGRLECFDADVYSHVLIPLTCLKEIKP